MLFKKTASLWRRCFHASPIACVQDIAKIRNIAIIAHVDHGKTSLVDLLLRQSGITIKDNTRVMDSNDLEKERGITILSKSTAIEYNGHRINIVDTPGHADFGGEVERVLSMVDGVCLVVCATEGPMSQTKFVLSKALARNLKPIVVMNKIDRETAQPDKVENDLLELFINLDASEDQLDYPILYASAKQGYASEDVNSRSGTVIPLLDKMITEVQAPKCNIDAPFSMLVTQIENDAYVGKCYLGKIQSGILKVGDTIKNMDTDGKVISEGKCTKIIQRKGLDQVSIDVATAGDIISIAGLSDSYVNHTLSAPEVTEPLSVSLINFFILHKPVLTIIVCSCRSTNDLNAFLCQ